MYVRIAFETARIYFSACELFIKHRVRIKKFVEIGNLKHLHGKN